MLAAAATLVQAGCGTIFWPERKGQPPGPLDPKVVALDAIGLILFFIPGVIAFAVDFSNGTIYLPPDERADADRSGRWKPVRTASKQPMADEIEQVLLAETGRTIHLRPGTYHVGKLSSVDELEDLNMDDRELAVLCTANEAQFRCQSE
jgi:hypothetical protein